MEPTERGRTLRQRPTSTLGADAVLSWLPGGGRRGELGRGASEVLDNVGEREGAAETWETRRSRRRDQVAVVVLTAIAASVRVYKLGQPPVVAWDEVHFGVFTSHYIRREYFFDIHPPLAKLLLALTGYLIGYDGSFEFGSIGESYLAAKVPYIGLRAFPALCGSLIPPVMFGIMREAGGSVYAAVLAAVLVLLDNGHVIETRLILLDGPMILFMVLAVYCYIRFYNLRQLPFSQKWWTWLVLTGLNLGATISCKMVGLFIFFTIGSAVIVDLLVISGVQAWRSRPARPVKLRHVIKHLLARGLGLIVVPSLLYLACFWVHLAILTKAGPGDEFMSPEFQRTIIGNAYLMPSEEIRYFDTITLRNHVTKGFLHVGENAVAGVVSAAFDASSSNDWIVEPTRPLPSSGRGRVVRHQDIIILRHALTNMTLHPSIGATSQHAQFSASSDAAQSDAMARFALVIDDAYDGQAWVSHINPVNLVNEELKLALVTRRKGKTGDVDLPVTGSRDHAEDAALWNVDSVEYSSDATSRFRRHPSAKPLETLPFWRRFLELQLLMLDHNSGITDAHPYTSTPITWPIMRKGISFWTGPSNERSQLYMTGNPVSWWLCLGGLILGCGVAAGSGVRGRSRRLSASSSSAAATRYKAWGTLFFAGWAFHYLPFFLMDRQTFLHHYLPAHLFSVFVTGVTVDILLFQTRLGRSEKLTVLLVVIAAVAGGFVWYSPLTYGTPLADAAAVRRRRLFEGWILQHTA